MCILYLGEIGFVCAAKGTFKLPGYSVSQFIQPDGIKGFPPVWKCVGHTQLFLFKLMINLSLLRVWGFFFPKCNGVISRAFS